MKCLYSSNKKYGIPNFEETLKGDGVFEEGGVDIPMHTMYPKKAPVSLSLTYFRPTITFYTPLKHQKTRGFRG